MMVWGIGGWLVKVEMVGGVVVLSFDSLVKLGLLGLDIYVGL